MAKVHKIRGANDMDIKILGEELAKDFEYSNWREADLAEYISKPNHGFLIIGSNPIGFIIYSQVLDEAEIIMLWISKEARKLGHGTALLNHLLKNCRVNHISHIHLEVAKDNQSAISLYRANGFVETGVRRAYYTRSNGETIDAIIMQNSCL